MIAMPQSPQIVPTALSDIWHPLKGTPTSRHRQQLPPAPIGKLLNVETDQTVNIDILLWSGFDMHDLSALLDVFSLANCTMQRIHFSWRVVGVGSDSIEASCGLCVRTEQVFQHLDGRSNALLLAGLDAVPDFEEDGMGPWLSRQLRAGVCIGMIGGASALLASAGMLDGRCCAAHWAHIDGYRQRHRRVNFRDQIYHIDSSIISCSGGCGTTDLALACVRDLCGSEAALKVADRLNRYRVRDEHDLQSTLAPAGSSLTRKAAQIMRQHIIAPIDVREIAGQLGTSLRRLQRSFQRHESMTPTQFYVRERLLHARHLLRQDPSLSIADIARHCGFASASDFARNFVRQFGYPPSRIA
jgi:AraC family carnitine catabolism transcriptional activator